MQVLHKFRVVQRNFSQFPFTSALEYLEAFQSLEAICCFKQPNQQEKSSESSDKAVHFPQGR